MSPMFRAFVVLALLLQVANAAAQTPVRVVLVEDRPIARHLLINGTVTSPRNALLSTAVAGIVANVLVDEGLEVKTGDPLLTLDAELAQLALERTVAEMKQQEVALQDAERRFTEAERVGTQRGIAQTTIESLRSEVTNDKAALAAAQAVVREQRAIVERHTLRAPFAGVVSNRTTDVGEWVSPGSGLLQLVEIDNLRFDFRVAQDNYSLIEPKAQVDVTFDAFPGRVLQGHVDAIVPVKNPGARTFLVRVRAETSDAIRVTPGMSVRGKLTINADERGIAVSRDGILRFPDGRATVWVVEDTDGATEVHERVVQTGLEFDGLIEIIDGVSAGERIVVRGNETLQEGQEVSILDGST